MAGSMVIGFDYIEQKLMILLQKPHFASEIVINIRYQTIKMKIMIFVRLF